MYGFVSGKYTFLKTNKFVFDNIFVSLMIESSMLFIPFNKASYIIGIITNNATNIGVVFLLNKNKNNNITTTTGTVLSNVIIGEINALNFFDSVDNITNNNDDTKAIRIVKTILKIVLPKIKYVLPVLHLLRCAAS
jgi:hypothetical protein